MRLAAFGSEALTVLAGIAIEKWPNMTLDLPSEDGDAPWVCKYLPKGNSRENSMALLLQLAPMKCFNDFNGVRRPSNIMFICIYIYNYIYIYVYRYIYINIYMFLSFWIMISQTWNIGGVCACFFPPSLSRTSNQERLHQGEYRL